MTSCEIKTQGVAYESYYVEADSAGAARRLFESGAVTNPATLEVESVEICSVTEVS